MADFCVKEICPSPFIPGFTLFDAHLGNGVVMRFARAGRGVPLLMVHGHPHNHVICPGACRALHGDSPGFARIRR